MITEQELIEKWGFNKTKALPDICKALNSLQEIRLEGGQLLVTKREKQIIQNIEIGMQKPLAQYNNRIFSSIIDLDDYYKEQDKKKQAQSRMAADLALLEKLERLTPGWRDKEWIKKHIGVYCTQTPLLEYYWTLIAGDYRKSSTGDVYITQDAADRVIGCSRFQGLKGSTFLGRKFKNKYGKSCGIIIDDEKATDLDYGVYGIFQNDQIVYIGSTIRPFEERWKEHRQKFEKRDTSSSLYREVKNEGLEYRVLFSVKDFNTNRPLSRTEIEAIELALITQYRPIGNSAGVKVPFVFTEKG